MRNYFKKLILNNVIFFNIVMILLKRRTIMNYVKKKIRGKNNSYKLSSSAIFINSQIDIIGNNNLIQIGSYCLLKNVKFYIRGDNNKIVISKSVKFNEGGLLWIEDYNGLILIEHESTFENVHIAVTEPNSKIHIGKDCMFAYDIDIRTGDSHSIIDLNSNERINYAKSVIIGDHVWVGPHCSILKGVILKQNSIVATRSVLTKSFEKENIIIGGIPATILKENVSWDRKRIYKIK